MPNTQGNLEHHHLVVLLITRLLQNLVIVLYDAKLEKEVLLYFEDECRDPGS